MTVSETKQRRRRFAQGSAKYGMTAAKASVLRYIALCGMLTTGQVERIAAISRKSAYNHLRDLFDLGLTERVAVPYADLHPPTRPDPAVSWAPGENIHIATKAGLEWLLEAEYVEPEEVRPVTVVKGRLMAHEVLIRDVRVWLEQCMRVNGGEVTHWVDGEAAHFSCIWPDAWFLYRLPQGSRTLVGMVEADRKTERGDRWPKKAAGYAQLIGSDELAEATSGRRNARVLAVTLDWQRRERIARDVAPSPVASSFYSVAITDMEQQGGLDRRIWRNVEVPDRLTTLVPPDQI